MPDVTQRRLMPDQEREISISLSNQDLTLLTPFNAAELL